MFNDSFAQYGLISAGGVVDCLIIEPVEFRVMATGAVNFVAFVNEEPR